jgi:hypothetical protein
MTLAITTARRPGGTKDNNSDTNNLASRSSCRRVVVPSWS